MGKARKRRNWLVEDVRSAYLPAGGRWSSLKILHCNSKPGRREGWAVRYV